MVQTAVHALQLHLQCLVQWKCTNKLDSMSVSGSPSSLLLSNTNPRKTESAEINGLDPMSLLELYQSCELTNRVGYELDLVFNIPNFAFAADI